MTTGCGGGSNTSSSAASKPPASLVAAADPICKAVAGKREAANAALREVAQSTAKTLQVLAQVAPGVAGDQRHEVSVLRALKLTGAASHSKDWQTMLLGLELLAADTTQLAVQAKAKDITAVHKIVLEGHKVQQKLTVIAARDGFTYCGRTS
jgi:hypothetical protein